MINIGYVEATCADNDVVIRVYYDTTFTPVGANQPLVNGPRGFCLDITNITGRNTNMTVSGTGGNPLTFKVGQGNPVTGGPVVSRSRTAAQMATLGFTTRGSIGNFEISC